MAQWQGVFLHQLGKKVVSPVQACNNHPDSVRAMSLHQSFKADFGPASAYCLLLCVTPKEDKNPIIIHRQAIKSYLIYPCIPASLLLFR